MWLTQAGDKEGYMGLDQLLTLVIASAFLSIVIVSYTERFQVRFFMPLRTLLLMPSKRTGVSSQISLPGTIPLKQSKDGIYLNPWEVIRAVYQDSVSVLKHGHTTLDAKDCNRLMEVAYVLQQTATFRFANGSRFAVWEYPIHFSYGLQPGWISGMAQARISVVLAAASKTASSDSLDLLAREALASLEIPVNDGGVLVKLDTGLWFEEYAQPAVKPPLVLNGHIYATLSLKELQVFDARAKRLYSEGIAAVAADIHIYDALTWSYYDRVGTPANNIYQQQLHADQLGELYTLCDSQKFLKYHNRFKLQRLSPFSSLQRFALLPSKFLGCLLLGNWGLISILLIFLKF